MVLDLANAGMEYVNFIAFMFACIHYMSMFFQIMYMYVDAKGNICLPAHTCSTPRTIKAGKHLPSVVWSMKVMSGGSVIGRTFIP